MYYYIFRWILLLLTVQSFLFGAVACQGDKEYTMGGAEPADEVASSKKDQNSGDASYEEDRSMSEDILMEPEKKPHTISDAPKSEDESPIQIDSKKDASGAENPSSEELDEKEDGAGSNLSGIKNIRGMRDALKKGEIRIAENLLKANGYSLRDVAIAVGIRNIRNPIVELIIMARSGELLKKFDAL